MMLVVQRAIGTPAFLLALFLVVGTWVATGAFGLDNKPFFILNICMSTWSAFTLPILTMSDRWLSEQQDTQLQQIYDLQKQKIDMERKQSRTMDMLVEVAEGQRDIVAVMAEQLRDIDKDVDDILGQRGWTGDDRLEERRTGRRKSEDEDDS